MSNYKKIGGNWVETIDPNSGKPYYANVVTKETTWEYPAAQIAAEKKKEDAKASAQAASAGDDVWLERQDPQGRLYYFNPALKKTSWHRPEKVISSGALQSSEDRKGEWVPRTDPRSGKVYYYNAALRQTSWVNPEEEAAKAAELANQGAVKRLSMKVAANAEDATKRLSAGLKRMSQVLTGNTSGNMTRHSARYSVGLPATPVNKTEARPSIKLGGGIEINPDGRLSQGRLSLTGRLDGADPFAALKALKNQGSIPDGDNDQDEESLKKFLIIDLDKETKEITADVTSNSQYFNYAAEHYNTILKSRFKSAQPLDIGKLAYWQNTNLKQPLHSFDNKDLVYDALMAFKNILFFCGDKNTKKSQSHHAQIFLAAALADNEDLHDEIYCQLMKQASNNPSERSVKRVWTLTALSCGTFKPSEALRPVVETHLKNAADNATDDHVKTYAKYSLLRLLRCGDQERRLEVPCIDEINAVIEYKPYSINITLVNSTAINMDVDAWTTIADVGKAVSHRVQIDNPIPFALFESNEDDLERVLDEEDRVMDIIAYWDRDIASRKTRNYMPDFRFVYKLRLYYDINENDTSAVELAYYQAVFDVNDSRYPCTEEDAVNLAAFEAQEKFGDYDGTDVFGDDVGAYLPAKFYDPDNVDEIKAKIYDTYQQLSGYDSFACKTNYLDYVKAWKFYGSAYFYAEPITNKILGKEFPKEVVLGVNAKGVLIIDPQNLDLLHELPYSEIVTWGYSARNFVFVVGNLVRSRKMFFETEEGLEMNSLIYAYINKLMEVEKLKA